MRKSVYSALCTLHSEFPLPGVEIYDQSGRISSLSFLQSFLSVPRYGAWVDRSKVEGQEMSEVLEVAAREQHGKLRNRRLRATGHLPAVLYGHGEESLSLSISADQLRASLRHGAKVVQLAGAAECQALLKDIQWDTFQQYVLHVDLLRVDSKDRVKIDVPVSLRGEAPGTHEGGVIEHLIHHIEIETSPGSIPEQLQANVNELHLGDLLKAAELSGLPEGATIIGTADTEGAELVVVQCVEPTVALADEDSAAEAAGIEPEVIGQKKDEDGEKTEAK